MGLILWAVYRNFDLGRKIFRGSKGVDELSDGRGGKVLLCGRQKSPGKKT